MWMVATGCLSRERLPIMSQAENHDPNTSFAWSEKGSINPPLHLRIHILRAQVSTKVTFQRRFFFESYANLQPKSIEGSKLKEKNCSTLPGWMLSRMAVSCIFFELGGAQVFEVLNLQSMGDQQNSVPLWYLNCGVYTKHSKELYFCSLGAVDVRLLEEQLPKKGQVTEQIARNLRTNGHTEFHWFQRASRISMKSCIFFSSWLKQSVWSTCSSFILFSGRQFLLQKEMERTT